MKRALPQIPEGRVIHPAPPAPAEGVVAWNMNTTCNYRCSYCTQRFLDDRHRWAQETPRFVEAFAALPAQTGVPWEVKLSGGEPFLHPGFVDVVAALAGAGLFVGVVTNFSVAELVEPFLRAAGDRLRVLSCSLHLEFVEARVDGLDHFVARAAAVQARMQQSGQGSLVVTCVATAANLPRLPELAERFAAVGVRFKVQPEKQDREIVAYDGDARALLYRLGGHNGTGVIAHDFGGQPCWAGARSVIVDDRGEAWRCYPARRYRAEHLGNVVQGTFRVRDAVAPCLYRSCNCTVPIARGMMPRAAVVDRFAVDGARLPVSDGVDP
jgi:MoaA/NifB/PqqE/SkfB family radical SAM enzyme